jgi:tRNA-specific 2-thiouridylase
MNRLIKVLAYEREAVLMKALALFSGGLDSILAVELIREQGVSVIGICFESPFFTADKGIRSAQAIGLPLKVVDITEDLVKIVLNPKHGYGKGMNPCIDCHALMFTVTGGMLGEEKAHFIISGEVLGQRPMSQNLRSLSTVSHSSGFQDLILRPLSAKLLPETIPEIKGWVEREKLLGLSGRSRRPQIELARRLGIGDYPSSAGGCLLTDKVISRRLKDLISWHGDLSRRDLNLLKVGRHFRLGKTAKITVGRDQGENELIDSQTRKGDTLLSVESFPGPTALATGDLSTEDMQLAADITASYSDAPSGKLIAVRAKSGEKVWSVRAMKREKAELRTFMI